MSRIQVHPALAASAFAAWLAWLPALAATPPLAGVAVAADSGTAAVAYDGVVEAVRQTTVAAQVPGTVVAVLVRAGDRVKAGQVLLRLDARGAEQQAGAAAAELEAARAADEAATQEVERQRVLFQKHYISQAALDRAEAQYRAARAQAAARSAAAGAARTQSGYYTLQAPYDGVVSDVPVVQGDLAMPGRALLTIHDPASLRVTAPLPQTAVPPPGSAPLVELGDAPGRRVAPVRWQALPAADAATHTVTLRLDLPPGTVAAPGVFARVWLAGASGAAAHLWVPAASVVRRGELTAVYVLQADGRPLLRQVRLGAAVGERVEVLAGVARGERVAIDPQAAARGR